MRWEGADSESRFFFFSLRSLLLQEIYEHRASLERSARHGCRTPTPAFSTSAAVRTLTASASCALDLIIADGRLRHKLSRGLVGEYLSEEFARNPGRGRVPSEFR